MKHTLAVLVLNKPGVLARISGLLSRRVFNIESIAASLTEEPDITRITIVVQGDDQILEQVVKQLSKLIDVIKIQELPLGRESIERELALIKVKASTEKRYDIVDIVNIFRAKIVDINPETMVIELSGDEQKIDALCAVLNGHGIIEVVRTGIIAISRNPVPIKQDIKIDD
ncbi:MAG: acetolactate synthase small subunit [Peptococcaceae bacterium]|nr:acetolactate synthase small subunit [Peptococcaceae bacterium]